MAGERVVRVLGVYSALVGVLYLAYGSLEVVAWVAGAAGRSDVAERITSMPLNPSRDLIAGLVLILIGSMLLYRVRDLMGMRHGGLAFLLASLTLATLLGAMYLLIAGADALDALIVGGEWSFDASAYNLPAIAFALALAPAWVVLRYRGEFK